MAMVTQTKYGEYTYKGITLKKGVPAEVEDKEALKYFETLEGFSISKSKKSEDDGKKSEDDGKKSDDDGKKSEDDGKKSEDDGKKSEDDGKKSEDDGKKSGAPLKK